MDTAVFTQSLIITSPTDNGGTQDIINPPFSKSMNLDSDPGLQKYKLTTGATKDVMVAAELIEGRQVLIIPEYASGVTLANQKSKVLLTVTGPTTHETSFGKSCFLRIPANCTQLQVENESGDSLIISVANFIEV